MMRIREIYYHPDDDASVPFPIQAIDNIFSPRSQSEMSVLRVPRCHGQVCRSASMLHTYIPSPQPTISLIVSPTACLWIEENACFQKANGPSVRSFSGHPSEIPTYQNIGVPSMGTHNGRFKLRSSRSFLSRFRTRNPVTILVSVKHLHKVAPFPLRRRQYQGHCWAQTNTSIEPKDSWIA